jgi:catechol-2,3-dioxygenase
MEKMARFYGEVLGLPIVTDEAGWKELDAGAARIALHRGKPQVGKAKIVFFVANVKKARAALVARGAKLGALKGDGRLELCDGRDPDGNKIQLSNRV